MLAKVWEAKDFSNVPNFFSQNYRFVSSSNAFKLIIIKLLKLET